MVQSLERRDWLRGGTEAARYPLRALQPPNPEGERFLGKHYLMDPIFHVHSS